MKWKWICVWKTKLNELIWKIGRTSTKGQHFAITLEEFCFLDDVTIHKLVGFHQGSEDKGLTIAFVFKHIETWSWLLIK